MNHDKVFQLINPIIEGYLKNLDSKGIGKSLDPKELRKYFSYSLKESGQDDLATLEDFKLVLNSSLNTLHPHFMNQLFSGLNPWSMSGDMLASLTNSTMATYEASPVATIIERELIRHLCRFIGWEDSFDGIMVTGGSNGNLVGLLMARNKLFPEIKENGPSKNNTLTLTAFVSKESHYSFEKAFNLLGLGLKNLINVETDQNGKLLTQDLKDQIQKSRKRGETPFFIAATAGTTVLGEFDPIEEMAAIAKQEKCWFHVDGAWGGSVLLSKKYRPLMKGIHLADSMSWDTHKMLGTGLVSSFFLTPHQHALRHSHAGRGGGSDYIFHESEAGAWDLGPSSLQCGRHNDAVKVWLAWRSLGDQGMEKLVDLLFHNARTAANIIKQREEFELLWDPCFLNVCFSLRNIEEYCKPEETLKFYQQLRQSLMASGKFMINMATREGVTFFRLITAHEKQDANIINDLLKEILTSANSKYI